MAVQIELENYGRKDLWKWVLNLEWRPREWWRNEGMEESTSKVMHM